MSLWYSKYNSLQVFMAVAERMGISFSRQAPLFHHSCYLAIDLFEKGRIPSSGNKNVQVEVGHGNGNLIWQKPYELCCSLCKKPRGNSLLLPQECTNTSYHALTQALVGHNNMSVVLALFLPSLAPAVDADRLIGFHNICDLKVWIHLFNKTQR